MLNLTAKENRCSQHLLFSAKRLRVEKMENEKRVAAVQPLPQL
jgi:hypothetical protein